MKELIRVIARLASIVLFIGGLAVCACEATDVDKQLIVGGIGLGMVLFSVFLERITREEDEDVLFG